MERSYRVWGLLGARAGDNAQVRALVRRLGWPPEFKQLAYNSWRALPNLALGASLRSLDVSNSDPLKPPWPDLVVAIGKRSVPVARWIQDQARGRCRLVHLGRPRAPFEWFDLIVTTPQYGLPPAGNLIEIGLPIVESMPPEPALLTRWQHEFADLPRPWTGVLVGGSHWPLRLGEAEAELLAGELLGSGYGSFLVSTSPRTGPNVAQVLKRALGARAYVYRWAAGNGNPHAAILALADRFVVTSDSLSLRSEAAAAGKPVHIHSLPRSGPRWSWRAEQGIMGALARSGIVTPPRGLGRGAPNTPHTEDVARVVARIQSLMPSL